MLAEWSIGRIRPPVPFSRKLSRRKRDSKKAHKLIKEATNLTPTKNGLAGELLAFQILLLPKVVSFFPDKTQGGLKPGLAVNL